MGDELSLKRYNNRPLRVARYKNVTFEMEVYYVHMLPSKLIIQELSTIPSECQQSRSVLGNVGNSLLSLGIVDNPEVDLVKVVYR